jgi:hypothetical protein
MEFNFDIDKSDHLCIIKSNNSNKTFSFQNRIQQNRKEEKMRRKIIILLAAVLLTGCSSVGTLGIVTKSTGDPGAMLRNAQPYKELGPVEGGSCRFFLLGVIPWGNGTLSTAADDALSNVGGDALINVTVSNSLYGFLPIYNIFAFTCTDVKGIAIKFEKN